MTVIEWERKTKNENASVQCIRTNDGLEVYVADHDEASGASYILTRGDMESLAAWLTERVRNWDSET